MSFRQRVWLVALLLGCRVPAAHAQDEMYRPTLTAAQQASPIGQALADAQELSRQLHVDEALQRLAPYQTQAWSSEPALRDVYFFYYTNYFCMAHRCGEGFVLRMQWLDQLDKEANLPVSIRALLRFTTWTSLAYAEQVERANVGIIKMAQAYLDRYLASRSDADRDGLRALISNMHGLEAIVGAQEQISKDLQQAFGDDDFWVPMSQLGIAMSYRKLGRYGEGLPLAQHALTRVLSNPAPDPRLLRTAYAETAASSAESGKLDEALPLAVQAAEQAKLVYGPNHDRYGRALFLLGDISSGLGDFANAEAYFKNATDVIYSSINPHEARFPEAARGELLYRFGRKSEGLAVLDHALSGSQLDRNALSSYITWVEALSEAGRDEDADKAMKLVDFLLKPMATPLHPGYADLAVTRSRIAKLKNEPDLQLRWAQAAVARASTGRSESSSITAWFELAAIADEHGDSDAAIYYYKQGAGVLQALRAHAASGDQHGEQPLLKFYEPALRRMIALLIDRGRLAEAEDALRMFKEEEYFDFIRRRRGVRQLDTPLEFSGRERGLAGQYQTMAITSAEMSRHFDQRFSEQRGTPDEAARTDAALQQEVGLLEKNFSAYFDAVRLKLASSAPSVDERIPSPHAPITRGTVESGTAYIRYLLVADGLRILVDTPKRSFSQTVALSHESLFRSIQKVRQQLARPDREPQASSHALYLLLFAPIERQLKAERIDTLYLSMDGALRYVPYSALHDGRRYLIERYALANALPRSASDEPAAAKMRVTSNRGFSGFGVSASGDAPILPWASQEVEAASQALRGEMQTSIKLDGDVTRTAIAKALQAKPRIVHLATHFIFKPGNDVNSYLLLGDGGKLDLRDFAQLDFAGVDLLTLSACETGFDIGTDDNGREIDGLSSSAIRAGAAAVLATLWPIADQSTSLLMHDFYKRLGASNNTAHTELRYKAALLRSAQLSLLRGKGGTAGYRHPYFWAAFQLAGRT